MQRDELLAFLRLHGQRLDTDLGQHFLIDEEILQAILFAAEIGKKDHIVEIGAGIGILTKELLQYAKHVTTIEIDPTLIPLLQKYTQATDKLTIIQGNALHQPFPTEPYKVVANIPYHITSPLLRHIFLESTLTPQSVTLLIQKEVAENICGEGDDGMLTILVGLFGSARIVTAVPPEAFVPPPKVDSAVLHIDCFKKPKADKETIGRLLGLMKVAFSLKRKMLRNSIGNLPHGSEAMKKVGISEDRRPQTLSVEEWIELTRAIAE